MLSTTIDGSAAGCDDRVCLSDTPTTVESGRMYQTVLQSLTSSMLTVYCIYGIRELSENWSFNDSQDD